MTLRGGWQDRRMLEHRGLRLWSGRPGTAGPVGCRSRAARSAVSGLEFMIFPGVWISGGVVARSVVYWAGFCRLCRRAALGVVMPRASLNVLRPGTGDLRSRPYCPTTVSRQAPAPVRRCPRLRRLGARPAGNRLCAIPRRWPSVAREPAPARPTPRCGAASAMPCQAHVRTHARGDDNRVW